MEWEAEIGNYKNKRYWRQTSPKKVFSYLNRKYFVFKEKCWIYLTSRTWFNTFKFIFYIKKYREKHFLCVYDIYLDLTADPHPPDTVILNNTIATGDMRAGTRVSLSVCRLVWTPYWTSVSKCILRIWRILLLRCQKCDVSVCYINVRFWWWLPLLYVFVSVCLVSISHSFSCFHDYNH